MPTWWFVRHGESLAQLERWPGPDPETPLSPLGERQADELAPKLEGLPIQRILVSPYLRAQQTAQRAMAKWGLAPLAVPDPISPPGRASGTSASLRSQTPFLRVDDLRERNSGDWLKNFRSDPDVNAKMAIWDFVPPNGESILQATQRALRVLHQHESEHNTIVFAHGRILAGVLAMLDQLDLAQPIHALDNCVAYERTIEPGTWARLLSILG